MKVYASIRNRPTWIAGWPHSGWRGVDPTEAGAKELLFGFDISDDGAGNFVLVYFSVDGVYGGDSWHETLADAYLSAEAQFGIQRMEWGVAK